MDHAQREKLSELIEELTTSGEPELNKDKMKEVKKICKVSNDYIEHVYHLIMTQLAQEHAEIRLSALQITDELFSRSHRFRTLLVSNLQEFMELTVETDAEQPLPPPKEVARKLKILAIRSVQSWQGTYGQAYKKLALGYHFLKQVKKVDFNDIHARTLAERRRQEEKQKRLERIYKDKVTKAIQEMEEDMPDIEECLTEVENCIQLLTPHPADFNLGSLEPTVACQTPGHYTVSSGDDERPCCSKDLEDKGAAGLKETENKEEESSEEESEMEEVLEQDTFIRNTGLMTRTYSLALNMSTDLCVKETEDNEAVVNTMWDLHRLISTKHLPGVQSWVQVFTKAGGNDALLRRALDLKKGLERALQKHEELHIEYRRRERRVANAGTDDEDDNDFEEVPEKEGLELHIPDHLRAEYGLEPASASTSSAKPAKPASVPAPWPPPQPMRHGYDELQDPTCAAATLHIFKQKLGSSSSASTSGGHVEPKDKEEHSEDKMNAPVIPFGIDLYYWGQEQPTAGRIIRYSSQHQFWVPHEVEEEVENKELSAQMKSRYITFAGRFEPVPHECRAPMPNGALCKRQDRIKCPFHGVIIPRDDIGNPINPDDAARLAMDKRKLQEEQPDWRDSELMREIEAATGEDLGSSKTFGKGKKGSKGKGKKKYPKLTDLKQSTNTARSRLERKVFNKSAMRRVTEAMKQVDRRKHEKFANQFNYALK
ncbi:UV-stimulated scaffold protein A isoform X1 [Conger conger]|uniref:UV-stimulated scaffold protein A isoform X1 n=2 Tax=Conger conger TaxID=82655 RepID=UPI002A5A1DD9|nr:UV-stimulated scaffold protein A isoform X1 [Conger conger]XP_061109309.1 UV-stimulated scaffold protein A isoform X1 [Conger conger]